ncbi:metallophosphoesterase family protein [Piscinibacter sp.]|uniref:metallophosphoesterase family protein n=1 Tax=Piscinibacter sp. TaxID=1903157 RepID=UPI002B6489E1|nr:metallophosphoesterase family protein [Albitalea sp.]HUG24832.1 metallophosphoesterase family protein [Albitalea sp.]
MKVALVTDLHANRDAVEAVMAHAASQGAQRYVFLGDFVGYGAEPGWVVDFVSDHVRHGAVAVMGNHDSAVVQGPTQTMVPQAREVVAWTRAQLDDDQLDFLARLPMSVTEGNRLYVHANAFAPTQWAYVVSRLEAIRSLLATECLFTFCGHVHEPRLFHLPDSGEAGELSPAPGSPVPLSAGHRWLIIPGATGQPRDGNPAACYAIFETEGPAVTFHRVAYDHEAAAAKIRAAGLPERLADRLVDGE